MKKKLIAPLAIVGSLALALMGGTAASAAEGAPMAVTPAEAMPGETVTISGEDCFVTQTEMIVTVDGEAVGPIDIENDGSWSIDIDAPSTAGTVQVEGRCETTNPDQESFDYAPASFTALGFPAWAEIGDITRDGCVVSIPVMTGVGTFDLEVWDDGAFLEMFTWDSDNPEGPHIVEWTINQPAAEGDPGVAFAVFESDGDVALDVVPNYEYPDEVAQQCAPKDDPAPVETPTPPKKVETAAAGSTQAGIPGVAGLFVLATLGAAVTLLRRNVTQQ